MRDDIKLKPYAKKLGFAAEVSSKGEWTSGIPCDPYSFVKGNVHIWYVRNGWRIARLVDNKFCDHTTCDDLTVALNTAEIMLGKG